MKDTKTIAIVVLVAITTGLGIFSAVNYNNLDGKLGARDKEFQKVFEFTDSDKWDDAQLKLGICYKNMGNGRRAKEEFKKLLDYERRKEGK